MDRGQFFLTFFCAAPRWFFRAEKAELEMENPNGYPGPLKEAGSVSQSPFSGVVIYGAPTRSDTQIG